MLPRRWPSCCMGETRQSTNCNGRHIEQWRHRPLRLADPLSRLSSNPFLPPQTVRTPLSRPHFKFPHKTSYNLHRTLLAVQLQRRSAIRIRPTPACLRLLRRPPFANRTPTSQSTCKASARRLSSRTTLLGHHLSNQIASRNEGTANGSRAEQSTVHPAGT